MTAFSLSWCGRSLPVAPTGAHPRFTTDLAERLDRHVLETAHAARFAHLAEVSPYLASAELSALGITGPAAEVGTQLACGGQGTSVVPRGAWLSQAACIDAARAAWQAAAFTVQVLSPSELSDRRWRAITSLQPYLAPTRGAAPRLVLVVDAADRLSPAALARLVDQASSSATKLVLVPGGTVPGRRPSAARSFDQLVDELAPGDLGSAGPGVALRPLRPAIGVDGLAVRGALSGGDAMAQMLAAWRATNVDPATGLRQANGCAVAPPVMLAYGPAEAEALNLAAREAWLGANGARTEVRLGGRAYAVGDRVLALGRLGAVRAGTWGTVATLEREAVTVDWRCDGATTQQAVGGEGARGLGYGYATTVPYLRPSVSPALPPLLVLGDPLQLGARSAAAISGWVTIASPGWPALGPGGPASRRRAGVAELATGWPDEAMLERAGPRPLAAAARQRWAELVTGCALGREAGAPPLAAQFPTWWLGPTLGHVRGMPASREHPLRPSGP